MGGPGRKAFDGVAWVDTNVIDGAVNGVGQLGARHRRAGRARPQTGFVRNYAAAVGVGVVLLLVLVRGRCGGSAADRRSRSSPSLVLVPAVGALRRRAPLASAGPSRQARRRCSSSVLTGAHVHLGAGRRSRPATAGFQFVSEAPVDQAVGHLAGTSASTASRCSSSCSPACCSRSRSLGIDPHHDHKRVPRLAAAARGRDDGRVPQPRPVPVLRVLRDRARADVLPHRRLGLRRAASTPPRSSSSTRWSARRSCSSASSPRRSSPRRNGVGTLTFDLVELAENAAFAAITGRWLFFAFADRVRGEGAAVPAAHLAARRPHPGAHRRLGDPRRRDAEARHLRLPALRPLPVPRGRSLEPPAVPHPRGDRHHLRRHRRHDAEGPQAAGRLLVGRPPRLHRARHVRLHVAGDHRRRAADDQPRRLAPVRCSSSSA